MDLRTTIAGLGLALAAMAAAGPQASGDERAIEIAGDALTAIERSWSIASYDAAPGARAAVNLRMSGARPVGVTANVLLDRRGDRLRLDAAGDVGPLTLIVAGGSATLHVPAVQQFARRPAGGILDGLPRLTAEIAAARSRLEAGYGGLEFAGEEVVRGETAYRLNDAIAPGRTASYWIAAESSLPLRIDLDRPGGGELQIDFHYGSGPRPTRLDVYARGQQDVQIGITPGYEPGGRVSRLHAEGRIAGGTSFAADVTLDWSPGLSASRFAFQPPAGAREVGFEQLVSGVLISSAGALGGFLPLFAGWL